MVNREECSKALEVIDDYVNGCALKENPTKYEANKSIEIIDKLINEYFELVDYIELIAPYLKGGLSDWSETDE